MKHLIFICLLSFGVSASLAGGKSSYGSAMNEIKSTFGIVPTFLKMYPQDALPGAWEEFKSVQLSSQTALDPKTKELIGLAVSSQIPCRYCVYFHKKAATFNGAKDDEIKTAIAVASSTRKWSAHFYGSQQDMARFKSDINRMVSEMKSTKTDPNKKSVEVVDAESAYKDIEATLGFVPEFMKSYSKAGIAGAWEAFKNLEMNPQTALAPKVKDLISLAVASQIPCQYCGYADTEFAKLDGASSQEIQEAVAMAGVVRQWSTFLNGLRQDEKAFEREVDQIFRHLERNKAIAPKKVTVK